MDLCYQFELIFETIAMPPVHYSAVKDQQLIMVCDSAAVSTGDISEVLSALKNLSRDRASVLSAEGAVSLIFHGYDDDPRELMAIPEVRNWFAKLFDAWPYWSFFANRTEQTIPLLITLLLPGEQVSVGEVGSVGWLYDFDQIPPFLRKMFGFQNELLQSFKISDDVNIRASRDFIEAVQAFISDPG